MKQVLALYLADDKPTLQTVADRMGTTFHNVQAVVKQHLSAERLKGEQALRYSRSKMGAHNPMQGKTGLQHPNYIGDVFTKDGYLQRKVEGRYVLVHRIVMAEALGLTELPATLEVHHIDEDKENNRLDNLAAVTARGHRELHAKRTKLQRSPLWAQWQSGISK